MPNFVGGPNGVGDRGAFIKYTNYLKEKWGGELRKHMKDQADKIVADLAVATPKDTGAASGLPTGKEMKPWHPGHGMTIGNAVYQTGWQVRYARDKDRIVITTPMWDPYLKFLEFREGPYAGFVRAVWQKHLASRKGMRGY